MAIVVCEHPLAMAPDLFSSSPADPQRDEVDNITTTTATTTNNDWPLSIPTITLSPSPDPQRMPPPTPPSSQDNSDYDFDSFSSEFGSMQIYGGSSRSKLKTATGGDVSVVGVNAQEREIRTKNDLHPYVQTLSLADLDSCVALENAAFPEEERCSREKVRENLLYIYFSIFCFCYLFLFSAFFIKKTTEIGLFSLPNLSRRHPAECGYIVLIQECRENISSYPFRFVYKSPPQTSSLSELTTRPPFFLTHTVHLPTQRLLPPLPRPLFYLFSALSLSPYLTSSPPLFLPPTPAEVRSHRTRHRHHGRHPTRYRPRNGLSPRLELFKPPGRPPGAPRNGAHVSRA